MHSVHDVGALTSTTLNRRFFGFGSDSSLGLDNTFVRSSLAGGRPSVTYEELYGGVDTSDLPAAAVPLVGSTLGTGPYVPGPYDQGPDVGPGPYEPGRDGLGPYVPGPNYLGPDDGPGPYGPEGDGPGPYRPGLSGSGLSGFGTAGVEIGGLGLSTAGLGVDRYHDESYYGHDGLLGTGFGNFDSLDDGFSVSSGSQLTGRSSVYPSAYYGPLSTGGRSSFHSSYQSTSPTYTDLYNRRFSSAGFGAGAGLGLGGALGSGFSHTSSFVDSLPYYDGAGYADDYGPDGGPDGGLGYLRRSTSTYTLPSYTSGLRRTRYFPRRQFTTRVYTYPPRVTTYQ